MPDQQLDRQAAQQRANLRLDGWAPDHVQSLARDVLAYEAALAAAEQERDEGLEREHNAAGQFLAQIDLRQAAERRAVRAEEQLALYEPVVKAGRRLTLDPNSDRDQDFNTLRTEVRVLAAASVAGGGQAVEPAAHAEHAFWEEHNRAVEPAAEDETA